MFPVFIFLFEYIPSFFAPCLLFFIYYALFFCSQIRLITEMNK